MSNDSPKLDALTTDPNYCAQIESNRSGAAASEGHKRISERQKISSELDI